MENYQYKMKTWDKYATIRSRPRRIIEPNEIQYYFFPLSKQPICIHPLVTAKGEEIIKYILIQTVNSFSHNIAILETEFVNNGALMIANNKFEFCTFPLDLCHDALSIIVDEAYHAYVALDFLKQLSGVTNVELLPTPNDTTVFRGVNAVKAEISNKYHSAMELIAVCIGEHVLTKELITFKAEENVSPTFQAVMTDHVADEGRHSNIFDYVLRFLWSKLPEDYKVAIGTNLHIFIREYLKKDIEIAYDRMMLEQAGFSAAEVDRIIDDTFVATCTLNTNDTNPVLVNLMNLLQRTLVLDHEPTAKAFSTSGFKLIMT